MYICCIAKKHEKISRRVVADALHQPAGPADNKKPVRNSNRPLTRCLKKRTGTSQFSFWLPLLDSLCCGKATAVATVHRTVAKSRLSGPAGGAADFWPSFLTKKKEEPKKISSSWLPLLDSNQRHTD